MKLIIAGSRSITDKETVEEAFEGSQFEWEDVEVLVNGAADGVDSLAREMIEDRNDVDLDEYPADDFMEDAPNPKVAPLLRNTNMAENADALLAVWDGESSGTEDMITKARKHRLNVEIHRTDARSLSDF